MSNWSLIQSRAAIAVIVFVILVLPSTLRAQQEGISGLVTDTSGAVVPNAKVKITNELTGVVVNLVSNQAGNYSAPSTYLHKSE